MASDTALIVDDNALNIELISFLLEADGYAVSTATNAEDALKAINQSVPALLVVDVQLPGISGLELITKLRANSSFATVCIVVVTSYAMDSDREDAYRSGCDGYLSKPIDTRSFAAQIRSILADRKLSRHRTYIAIPSS